MPSAPDPLAPRRALFVTYLLPDSRLAAGSGVFRRQAMLVEALRRACGRVDILHFRAPVRDGAPSDQVVATTVRQLYGDDVAVHACDQDVAPVASGLWGTYLRPASGFLRLPDSLPYAGARQAQALAALLEKKPDLLVVHRLRCVAPLLRMRSALPPVLIDLDDVEHIAHARAVAQPPTWPGKRLQYLQIPALLAGERAAARLAHSVFVCSATDRDRLERICRRGNIAVLPNAVDMPKLPAQRHGAGLLMVGNYGYEPNRIGIEHFLARIWPLVLTQRPEARLVVAGRKPERIAQHSAPPQGVEFRGFVDDLAPLYAEARVVICPILSGSGTRVKIVEAAAHGAAVVSTTLGAEGLGFTAGRDILLADRPAEFAMACAALLADAGRAAELGRCARETAERLYDGARVTAELATTFAQACRGGPRS